MGHGWGVTCEVSAARLGKIPRSAIQMVSKILSVNSAQLWLIKGVVILVIERYVSLLVKLICMCMRDTFSMAMRPALHTQKCSIKTESKHFKTIQ